MKNNKYNNLAYELKISKINNNSLEAKEIKGVTDVYNFAKNFYFDDIGILESVFMIILNRANLPIGWYKISKGGTNGTTVDVKLICKIAVDSLASGIILIHNHPSGSLKPSKEDINVTSRTKDALALFDIRLVDHLIITENSFYSFAGDEELRKYICS